MKVQGGHRRRRYAPYIRQRPAGSLRPKPGETTAPSMGGNKPRAERKKESWVGKGGKKNLKEVQHFP